MKVTLVTRNSTFGRFVAAALAQAGGVDRVLIESERAPLSFFVRKLRKVGPLDFAFQGWLNHWFDVHGARHLPKVPLPPHERIRSINEIEPDPDELFLGFGSSIVAPETLARMPFGMLNLHTGILPQYRGVKSEFWALRNGDPAGIGWTLHYMTSRLDRGAIVSRRVVAAFSRNPAEVRAGVLLEAMAPIGAILHDVRAHNAAPGVVEELGAPGRYYSSPTWSEWREYRARM